MKMEAREEFDVFELFVHDNEAILALDTHAVADAINERLDDWRVYPPDSLSRFTLYAANDEEERYTERYYSVEQVRDALPSDAVQQLEDINETELDISPR
jgi:hypothetical protein